MFRTFLLGSAAALVSTAAIAASDTGTITVEAVISEFIEIEIVDSTQTYTINGLTPIDTAGSQNEADKAKFMVTSNTDWAFDVSFPPWPATVAQGGNGTYEQAAFGTNESGDLIGGSLHVDENLGLNQGNNGLCRQNSAGVLTSTFMDTDPGRCQIAQPGAGVDQEYWLGAQVSPGITDAPGGVPAPGTYSLDAVITVTTN